jgi:hypothetical protein
LVYPLLFIAVLHNSAIVKLAANSPIEGLFMSAQTKLCEKCPRVSFCTLTEITEDCPPQAPPPEFIQKVEFSELPWDSREGEYH